MSNKKNEELIIGRLWLEAVNKDLEYIWGNNFEEFKEHYYGRFDTPEEYAQNIIEDWDRSNLIPILLSGRIRPSDLLNDQYYMSQVYPFYGPNPENPDETVIYVFHTQGYYDRMDG